MAQVTGGPHEVRLARMLFVDLADSLDEALGAESGSRADLDRVLDSGAGVVRAGGVSLAAFEGIAAPEALRFDRAFAAARNVAAWIGLEPPEPEAFWAAGVDRAVLARALIADTSLVPVPAPHGLGADVWTSLYRAAARRPASPLSLSSPLMVAEDVVAAFEDLDAVPRSVPAVEFGAHLGRAVRWTLRLIPAGPTPPRTNLNHAFGPHPTLPEMLMLQLMLLEMKANGSCEDSPGERGGSSTGLGGGVSAGLSRGVGTDVMDRQSFTWLHGTFAGDRFAARHFFDAAGRSVGINTRETGNQGPHLGVRSPIG